MPDLAKDIKPKTPTQEQAEAQRKPFSPPVLMVTSNYRPILAVMDLRDWLNLVKEKMDLEEKLKEVNKK